MRDSGMRHSWRVALVALTLAFVCLASVLAFLLPMFSNYDEQTHLDRVELTADNPGVKIDSHLDRTYGSWSALLEVNGATAARAQATSGTSPDRPGYLSFQSYPGGLSQQHDACPGGLCQNYQYTQPPLWYVLMAPFAAVLRSQPFPRTFIALRVLDVLLAASVVPLAWWTARQLWPGEERRPIAVATLVATFGPLAFMAAGVNNDSLMLALAATVIAMTAAVLCTGVTLRRCIVLGVTLAAGLLTKVELMVLAPVAIAAVVVAPRRCIARWKALVTTAGLALPGVLWWLSQQVNGGVLSPSDSEVLAKPGPGPWRSANVVTYSISKIPMLLDRFWGLYGVPPFLAPTGYRIVLWVATLLLLVGWLASRPWRRPPRWHLAVLVCAPIALVVSVLYASFKTYHLNGEVRGLTPRYLYPALSLFAIAAVAAATAIAARLRSNRARTRRWGLAALIGGGAAVGGAASVVRILHGLYGTGSWSEVAARAELVSPTRHPVVIATVLGALWVVSIAVAAWATTRGDDQSSTTWARNDSLAEDQRAASNVPSGRSASAAALPMTSA